VKVDVMVGNLDYSTVNKKEKNWGKYLVGMMVDMLVDLMVGLKV
jgi:hypothetical protein